MSRPFRVALSFSGEIRTKVRNLARQLQVQFSKDEVFYDADFSDKAPNIDFDLYLQERGYS
ncbi:MAG: hypothetical protein AAF585_09780 [Verrucomicrobiota bacterium]